MTTRTPQAGDPVEVIPAVVNAQGLGGTYTGSAGGLKPMPVATRVAVTPTQVRRPWRSTLRTIFQAFVGLCVLAPILVSATGLDPEDLPWLGVVLAVAAAVTRIMALPGVEQWLRKFLPFLAAAPRPKGVSQ